MLENREKYVILLSHIGGPIGNKNKKFSLQPLVPTIEDLLKRKVSWAPDCVGADTKNIVSSA